MTFNMLLPGERVINQAFNYWLEKYGFSVRVSGMANEHGYYHFDDTIVYTLVYVEDVDKAWENFLEQMGCRYIINCLVSSFLHEAGHSETMHLLTEEEIEYSAARAADKDITNEEYFRLPREIIATQWAIDFINNEIDKVQELCALLEPLIKRFWELNQLEG